MKSASLKRIALRAFIGIYLALGIYTELGLMEILPLPKTLLADYFIYERAAKVAPLGKDPYLDRRIGSAFIYPPQSLLFFEAFGIINQRSAKIWFFMIINIAMLVYMTYGTIRYFGLSQADAWFLYPLALGFAPFLELLHVGQVNQFIEFGLFLMFAFATQAPWLSGFGLGWAAMLKVTPAVFGLYLLIAKKWKATIGAISTVLIFTILAWMRYGADLFLGYIDGFLSILGQFPTGIESHSLYAVINRFTDLADSASLLQIGLDIYLVIIMSTAAISFYSHTSELFFVTLGLCVTLTPNLLWYHHYVFLLFPLFILICWSHLDLRVVAWCLLGLIIIQVDRFYLTAGLLIHLFGHITIIGLVIYQIGLARQKYLNSKPRQFDS